MEIVVQIFLINLDEVLFPLDGILGRLPNNLMTTQGINTIFWRAKQTIAEKILEGLIAPVTNDNVFLITSQY